MRYGCLDQNGELLAIVYAESPEEALAKAPTGTMKVEEMPEQKTRERF